MSATSIVETFSPFHLENKQSMVSTCITYSDLQWFLKSESTFVLEQGTCYQKSKLKTYHKIQQRIPDYSNLRI